VTVYDFVGLLAGVTGLGLALLGLVVAFLAAPRALLTLRRPEHGRLARAMAVFGLVLLACGLGLFFLAELSPFRRGVDRGVLPLTVLAVLLAVLAALRAGRRRRAPQAAQPQAATVPQPASLAEKDEKAAEPPKAAPG
jgi:uncharacterized membrane protein